MPRYEDPKRGWWVEIEGAADMPQSALFDLYGRLSVCAPIMARLVKAHNLTDWDGQPVDLTPVSELSEDTAEDTAEPVEPISPISNVSRRQLTFIRASVVKAISDEELDPEA